MLKTTFKKISATVLLVSTISLSSFSQTTAPNALACNKAIVGYWHSWNNPSAPYIKLRNIPACYNVVMISFIESTSPSDMTMVFRVDSTLQKEKEIIDDIKYLKSKGVRVIASIGGANGYVDLTSGTDKTKFITTVSALIKKYGFNGLDIDIEAGYSLSAEDSDINNPKSAKVVNLADAIRSVVAGAGGDFWLTMAPEVTYVQGGFSNFGGVYGAYLPLINKLRDILTYIHVQYYNGAGCTAKDGKSYNQSTPDLIVALSHMLLSGFSVAGKQNFTALRADQVSLGLPATPGNTAAPSGGYVSMGDLKKALDYLTKGTSFGGSYNLGGATYPGLRGAMTWSINWDKKNSIMFDYGKTCAQYFCGTTQLWDNTDVGTHEMDKKENAITLSPNPANDKLYINSTLSVNAIEIYNIAGLLVKKTTAQSIQQIDIKELSTGIYLVRLITENDSFSQRIVKN